MFTNSTNTPKTATLNKNSTIYLHIMMIIHVKIHIVKNTCEGGLNMLWLILLSPLIVLVPIVIYFDKKKGMGNPKLDSENHRIEQDLARNDTSFISHGGDGPAQ